MQFINKQMECRRYRREVGIDAECATSVLENGHAIHTRIGSARARARVSPLRERAKNTWIRQLPRSAAPLSRLLSVCARARFVCVSLFHTLRAVPARSHRDRAGIVNPNGILSGLRRDFRTRDFPGSSSSSGLSARRGESRVAFLLFPRARARRLASPRDFRADPGSLFASWKLFRSPNAP